MDWVLIIMWAYNTSNEIHTEVAENREQSMLLGEQLMAQARKTYVRRSGAVVRVSYSCHPKGKAASEDDPHGAA